MLGGVCWVECAGWGVLGGVCRVGCAGWTHSTLGGALGRECWTIAGYLLVSFEDIAAEGAVRELSGYVAEDLHVLGVVGHVEYPGGLEGRREGGEGRREKVEGKRWRDEGGRKEREEGERGRKGEGKQEGEGGMRECKESVRRERKGGQRGRLSNNRVHSTNHASTHLPILPGMSTWHLV